MPFESNFSLQFKVLTTCDTQFNVGELLDLTHRANKMATDK